MLRQKTNFGVLEGFLTVFLNEPIEIVDILESEGKTEEKNAIALKMLKGGMPINISHIIREE